MSRIQRGTIIKYIILCLVSAIMVVPMIWAVSVSLAGPGKAYAMPPKFFEFPLMFSNYLEVLSKFNFLRAFGNTAFICIVTIIAAVISNSLVAFGFAKYETKKLSAMFFVMLCTTYVPAVTTLVPSFVLWSKLGALDTYIPLILPAFFGAPVWVFLLRQNFKSISNSFFEAAYIDGANPFYILFKIYMPLSKPALATLVLRLFMASWNDLMHPLIYLSTKSKYTIALSLSMLGTETMGRTELTMAGAVMGMIPVIIVYLFAQKYFVGGVVSSGVKE